MWLTLHKTSANHVQEMSGIIAIAEISYHEFLCILVETVALRRVPGGVGMGPVREANSKFCVGYFQEAFRLRLTSHRCSSH